MTLRMCVAVCTEYPRSNAAEMIFATKLGVTSHKVIESIYGQLGHGATSCFEVRESIRNARRVAPGVKANFRMDWKCARPVDVFAAMYSGTNLDSIYSATVIAA